MSERRVSSILVVEDDRVVGIWTERDALRVDFDDPTTFAPAGTRRDELACARGVDGDAAARADRALPREHVRATTWSRTRPAGAWASCRRPTWC